VHEAVARRFTQVALPIFRPSVKSPLRVLVVAYSFPPVGGAGVQRVTKLVKYLAMHGVRPAVLTVANPSVPLYDASLERDLPPGLEVVRARTLEPSYAAKRAAWSAASPSPSPSPSSSPSPSPSSSPLAALKHRLLRAASSVARELLVPDAQVLWLPAAEWALASRLRARKDDALFISGPPFSQFLLEPLARLSPRVAVVLDYRDEWSTWRTTYEMTSRLAAVAGARLERALVTRADAVTTATEEFRANLLARLPSLDPARVFAIPNGYDPEDFPSDLPSPPRGGPLQVTYAGTVFKLTSARGLLDAVRLLHARRPDLAGALRLRFIGRVVDTELDAFEGTERLGVERVGYLPHDEVLRELAASHLTLCLLDDVPGAERIYPAKIFELMALGRPALTLAPPGALARLVEGHALGKVVAPRDTVGVARALEEALEGHARGEVARSTPKDIARYDRRSLAGEIADVVRLAVAQRAR
jgi:glycosyltransferase involved in cell wall biosynthesis